MAEGVQSGTSSQFVGLPFTCSRSYNAGNSNLRSGILYGGRSGTLGLIINEFIFDWGSAATITFAAINVVGFAVLAFVFWVARE